MKKYIVSTIFISLISASPLLVQAKEQPKPTKERSFESIRMELSKFWQAAIRPKKAKIAIVKVKQVALPVTQTARPAHKEDQRKKSLKKPLMVNGKLVKIISKAKPPQITAAAAKNNEPQVPLAIRPIPKEKAPEKSVPAAAKPAPKKLVTLLPPRNEQPRVHEPELREPELHRNKPRRVRNRHKKAVVWVDGKPVFEEIDQPVECLKPKYRHKGVAFKEAGYRYDNFSKDPVNNFFHMVALPFNAAICQPIGTAQYAYDKTKKAAIGAVKVTKRAVNATGRIIKRTARTVARSGADHKKEWVQRALYNDNGS